MVGDAVSLDVGVDPILVVDGVTEGIEDLRQGQMSQAIGDLFWCHAQPRSIQVASGPQPGIRLAGR